MYVGQPMIDIDRSTAIIRLLVIVVVPAVGDGVGFGADVPFLLSLLEPLLWHTR